MTVYAAICARCAQYRYRTSELPTDVAPTPEDFVPIAPQATLAENGKKATCDTCAADLKFVKGADWEALTKQIASSNGHSPRVNVAPAPIAELFRVEAGEEVREMRGLSGDRILIITNRRVVSIDPNLLGGA